jgi:hypothetical protein
MRKEYKQEEKVKKEKEERIKNIDHVYIKGLKKIDLDVFINTIIELNKKGKLTPVDCVSKINDIQKVREFNKSDIRKIEKNIDFFLDKINKCNEKTI